MLDEIGNFSTPKMLTELPKEKSFWIKPYKNATSASLVVDRKRVEKYLRLSGDWKNVDWFLVTLLEELRKSLIREKELS